MAKVGAPSLYRKDFHPKDFIERSKGGKSLKQIALAWDIDVDTIGKWAKRHAEFEDAVKKGRDFAEAWWQNLGHAATLDQAKIEGQKVKVHLGFFVWMTKNMFHWSDKVENKNEVIANVTAVTSEADFKELFKDQESLAMARQLALKMNEKK